MANVCGHTLDLEKTTMRLLEHLERRYLQLRSGHTARLKYEYLQALYRYQEQHSFRVDNKEVQAQIVGVGEDGKLALEIDRELRYFAFQELSYVI